MCSFHWLLWFRIACLGDVKFMGMVSLEPLKSLRNPIGPWTPLEGLRSQVSLERLNPLGSYRHPVGLETPWRAREDKSGMDLDPSLNGTAILEVNGIRKDIHEPWMGRQERQNNPTPSLWGNLCQSLEICIEWFISYGGMRSMLRSSSITVSCICLICFGWYCWFSNTKT